MSPEQLREFQVAVAIHSMLDQPKRTKDCASALGIKASYAKVVVSRMARRGLIRTAKGNGKQAGISRIASLKEVYDSYRVPVGTKVEPIKPQKVPCDVCGELDVISNEDKICNYCLSITEPPLTKMVARCGHPSSSRYFVCERCHPELEEESLEFSLK